MIKLPFILSQTFAQATIIIAIIAMAGSIHKPLRLLGMFIIFRPILQPASSLSYSLSFIHIGTVLPLLLIFAAGIDLMRPGRKIFTRGVIPLYLVIIFSLPSLIITPNISEGITITVKMLTAISAFLLAFYNTKSVEDIYKIYRYFMISSIIPVLFGFYQYVTKTGHMWKSMFYAGTRIDSVLMEWNDYGIYLSILICLFILRYSTKVFPKPKLYEHAIFLAIVVSFILALNRGSWIALTIGLVGALSLYKGAVKMRWLAVGFFVVAIAAGGIIVDRFEEMNRLNALGYKPDTFQGRINGWLYTLEILSESPLTGLGAGASRTITDLRGDSFAPHNDYVRILFESGPFACLAFCAFMLSNTLAHVRRSKMDLMRSINYPLFALAIYYVIISATQNILTSATIFPMMLICLAMSAATVKINADLIEQNKEKKEQ